MSTDVKFGSRIIGVIKQEPDGSWSYTGQCVHASSKPKQVSSSTKDDAKRSLRASYVAYALLAETLPPDLNWYTLQDLPGREFLMRPPYTQDSRIYGQRRRL